MDLVIDTGNKKYIYIALKQGNKVLAEKKQTAERKQSELLLASIDKLLKNNNFKISDIDVIYVNPAGDSFSALRIGVVTANALGFALKIPVKVLNSSEIGCLYNKNFNIVEPKYNKEPNITKKKNKL